MTAIVLFLYMFPSRGFSKREVIALTTAEFAAGFMLGAVIVQ